MSDAGDTLYVGPVWIGPEPDPINSDLILAGVALLQQHLQIRPKLSA